MTSLALGGVPVMQTGMLVRRSTDEVFQAIVDPAITTKFWFTKSSGRLDAGKQVRWTWEMYDVSADVTVKAVDPATRIVIEWPGYTARTTVEWTFHPLADGTFVNVTESGFTGDGDSLVKQVTDSIQGFSLMLAGLKAYLEHGIQLNLVADRYPAGSDQRVESIEDETIQFFDAVGSGDVARAEALLSEFPHLARARDGRGATGLHHAAFRGHRDVVALLVANGADVNARDGEHDATPTGWAVHYLRELGGLLAVEIEDARYAIETRDVAWTQRLVRRHPALVTAADSQGKPLAEYARESGEPAIVALFTSASGITR